MRRYKDTEYIVYQDGKIFSERLNRFIALIPSDFNYIRVYMNRKQRILHRIVAELYVPNPHGYKIVNHIDNNPTNNHYTNLEWCTQKMNYEHAKSQGRNTRGEKVGISKLNETDIKEIRKLYKTLPNSTIGKMYGVSKTNIRYIGIRKTWNHIED